MHRGMSKPCILKVGCYAAFMMDLNEYLAVFPGAKESGKICVTELNGFF